MTWLMENCFKNFPLLENVIVIASDSSFFPSLNPCLQLFSSESLLKNLSYRVKFFFWMRSMLCPDLDNEKVID